MAEKQTVVEQAKARFEKAKAYYSRNREQALADTRFAMGDSDNNWQWPDDVFDNRSVRQRKPCLTVNITAQHCNQVENQIRQNRPSARVVPVDSDADVKTATILGGMIRSIQAYSNADTAHDTGAKHAILGGEGYWRVLTEYESETSFDQVIMIKPLVNPRLVYIDPDSIEPDRSDARWGLIFEDIPKDQAEREYGSDKVLEWGQDGYEWCGKDTVRRAEYFWREDTPDTLLLLDDGSTILKSQAPKGAVIIDTRPAVRKQWKWARICGGMDEPEDQKDWPGSYLPIICVVGQEVNVDGEIIRKGLVRDLKDSARMVNYSYSAAVETIALQTKTPWLTAAEAIEGHEDIWNSANIESRPRLTWNAFDDQGNALPIPSRIAPAQMATAQVQMLELSVEQMRAASGQQNANFGIKSDAQSGIGIQRLKQQGEVATFHYPDNLARAQKYELKVILDLIPKVYSSKRIVRIVGLDGKETAAMIDPDYQEDAADIKDNPVDHIFNPLLGRYDVALDTGPSYQTMRQEAAGALTELSGRAPVLMQAAPDLVVKALDFPGNEELAERLRRTVPPQLLGDQEDEAGQMKQALDQATQQIQVMQQVGSEMSQELTKLQQEKAAKLPQVHADMQKAEMDHSVAVYEAETRRMQALAPAIDPAAIQALVVQTVQQMLAPQPDLVEQQEIPGDDMLPMIPPEMAAAGAQPDPGMPVPPEGNLNV
jgi:flagellar hook-basal body complex protein FliE